MGILGNVEGAFADAAKGVVQGAKAAVQAVAHEGEVIEKITKDGVNGVANTAKAAIHSVVHEGEVIKKTTTDGTNKVVDGVKAAIHGVAHGGQVIGKLTTDGTNKVVDGVKAAMHGVVHEGEAIEKTVTEGVNKVIHGIGNEGEHILEGVRKVEGDVDQIGKKAFEMVTGRIRQMIADMKFRVKVLLMLLPFILVVVAVMIAKGWFPVALV